MNQTVSMAKEQISILMDGELDRAHADALITTVCGDVSLRHAWHELHLAGDALRSHEVAACDADHFCARVAAALASEPTVLTPRAMGASRHRSWIPAVAVAASVAAIGLIAVPLLRAPDSATVVTAAKSAPTTEAAAVDASQKAATTIVNAREVNSSLNPYLAAHRELTGGSVVPRAAVYLRSDEGR